MKGQRREKSAALSEAQLQIMQEVWKRGEATVTEVWEALVKDRPVARNTVHTLMERLEKKGWLKRRIEASTHYFAATTSRTSAMEKILNRFVDKVFGGSAEGLVVALLKGRALTGEEVKRIHELIKKSEQEDS